jgi:hypothetical protein
MVSCSATAHAPSLSVSATLHLLLPNASGAGTKVSKPVELSWGAMLNSARLSQSTSKLTVWLASLAGPGDMLVAQGLLYGPESSKTVTVGAPLVKVGGSLTATVQCQTINSKSFHTFYKVLAGEMMTSYQVKRPCHLATHCIAGPHCTAVGG